MRPGTSPQAVSGVREIPLTKGYVAIVDAADFEWLSQWRWFAHRSGTRIYARRAETHQGTRRAFYMHRQIMGFPAIEVDHRNRVTLDNRRENLRLATSAQNSWNTRRRPSAVGYKGVCRATTVAPRWSATIAHGGVVKYLGLATTPEGAARLYDQAARQFHGEFAVLNFPDDTTAALSTTQERLAEFEAVQELQRRGLTVPQIAERLGVGYQRAYYFAKKRRVAS